MSLAHLRQLRAALEEHSWVVCEESPGNDYEVSGYWKVTRPNGTSAFWLAFEGLEDMVTLPIEKSYGCHVVGKVEVGLYFGHLSKSFPDELASFIAVLSCGDA